MAQIKRRRFPNQVGLSVAYGVVVFVNKREEVGKQGLICFCIVTRV